MSQAYRTANKLNTTVAIASCKTCCIKCSALICAPLTTLDINTACGKDIEIEQRNGAEVRGVSGSFGEALWAPTNAKVYNPAFDVTPAKLITGWVLDSGVYSQADIKRGALRGF